MIIQNEENYKKKDNTGRVYGDRMFLRTTSTIVRTRVHRRRTPTWQIALRTKGRGRHFIPDKSIVVGNPFTNEACSGTDRSIRWNIGVLKWRLFDATVLCSILLHRLQCRIPSCFFSTLLHPLQCRIPPASFPHFGFAVHDW